MMKPQVPKFFNPDGTDTITKEKLVHSEEVIKDVSGMWNLNRIQYPQIHDWFFETSWSFLWRPEDIEMVHDRVQFERLEDRDLKFAVENMLSFLQYMDSIVPTNDISLLMAIPEYEIRRTLMVHQFIEGGIHTYSYQYILKTLFDEDKKKIDEVYRRSFTYAPLAERNKKLVSCFQDLLEILPYKLLGIVSQEQFERALFRSMIQDYLIEGVVFYTGFNFFHLVKMNYKDEEGNSLLAGTNQNILLIRRDENSHIPLFEKIIKTLREKGLYFNEDEVYEIADNSAQADISFYKEVVGDRIKGLSSREIETYIKYLTDKRLKGLGLKPIYGIEENPYEQLEEIVFKETSQFRKGAIFETGNADYQQANVDLSVDDIIDEL